MHKNKIHDEFQVLTILISAVPVLWWFKKDISSGNTTACFSFRVYVHNNIKLLILLMLKLSNTIKTSTEGNLLRRTASERLYAKNPCELIL